MYKIKILAVLFGAIFLTSCRLIYCTTGDRYVLTDSAKIYEKQMILPVKCDLKQDRLANKVLKNAKPADLICREKAEEISKYPRIFPEETYFQTFSGGEYLWGEYFKIGLENDRKPTMIDKIPELYSVYMFLWMGYQRGNIAILVENGKNGRFLASTVDYMTSWGCEKGRKVVPTDIIRISDNEWKEFEKIIEESNYWNDNTPIDNTRHYGSDHWELVGKSGNKYKYGEQYDPVYNDTTAVKRAGVFLMKLAGFEREIHCVDNRC